MPALAPVVDTLEAVPEPLRTYYVPKDGKFVVELSAPPAGYVPAADLAAANGKVVEFRDNNVTLMKEVETLRPLKTQFEGLDPVVAKAAITELASLKAKGVSKPDDITAMIQQAVIAAVKPLQDQITESRTATQKERERADEATLRSIVGERFIKAGGLAKALDYILGQAKQSFKVENGTVVALPTKFSVTNPGNPLEIDEWLTAIKTDNDFAFKPSQGGGAPPAGGGGAPHRAGQTILRNPSPQQLGDAASDIKAGKVRVEYDNVTVARS